ncbi:MAG TPA: hypothetical protein VGU46_06940 [Acidobacteriaceae bacterium]|nr:hypothetical protein [Acidobacteriaceae bacterium]
MNVSELRDYVLDQGMSLNTVWYGDGARTAAEQYCISKQGSAWEVYYLERDNHNDLRIFSDEQSACAYLKSVLDNDQSVQKHRQKRQC